MSSPNCEALNNQASYKRDEFSDSESDTVPVRESNTNTDDFYSLDDVHYFLGATFQKVSDYFSDTSLLNLCIY